MSLLPEEFPVVVTVFLALGAYRMAREKVLARRMAALETLGATTVLCTDKTGTLTENRMKVVEFTTALAGRPPGATVTEQELRETSALACPRESFDPMDEATLRFAQPDASVLPALREYRSLPASGAGLARRARGWGGGRGEGRAGSGRRGRRMALPARRRSTSR
jgi:Ca2+-transporting ATPase